MIAGLCESPLTFQAIIIWRDELNEGKILLRDIIDLEATYEGPEAKMPPPVIPGEAGAPALAAPAPPAGRAEGGTRPLKAKWRTRKISRTPCPWPPWRRS